MRYKGCILSVLHVANHCQLSFELKVDQFYHPVKTLLVNLAQCPLLHTSEQQATCFKITEKQITTL